MKLPLIFARSLVLSAALLAPVFATQPSPTPDRDAIVPLYSKPIVSRGMSRDTVAFMLGIPGAKLSPNAWIYWDFKMKGVPGSDDYDTLIVGFTGDRVTYLRITRSEQVRAFIAQEQVNALKTRVGAK